MNYFRIVQKTVNVSPFETVTANAIRWATGPIPRGTTTAELSCTLILVNDDEVLEDQLYSWTLYMPEAVISAWLNDSVVDDFIISESRGVFVKA